jgi:hypothetical protein
MIMFYFEKISFTVILPLPLKCQIVEIKQQQRVAETEMQTTLRRVSVDQILNNSKYGYGRPNTTFPSLLPALCPHSITIRCRNRCLPGVTL